MSAEETAAKAPPKGPTTPLLQATLPYLVSPRELTYLYKHVGRLNPSFASVIKRQPSPAEQSVKEDVLVRDMRHSARVFAAVLAAMKLYGTLSRRFGKTYRV